MEGIIKILDTGKVRIFIRNHYYSWFADNWHLINIERKYFYERIEYKLCLIGFELVFMVKK